MAQNQNKITKKLKSYHLFLISLLLGSLLILNSNYVRDKKADDNTEKSPLFNKIITIFRFYNNKKQNARRGR